MIGSTGNSCIITAECMQIRSAVCRASRLHLINNSAMTEYELYNIRESRFIFSHHLYEYPTVIQMMMISKHRIQTSDVGTTPGYRTHCSSVQICFCVYFCLTPSIAQTMP
jgi:hypothetical protein